MLKQNTYTRTFDDLLLHLVHLLPHLAQDLLLHRLQLLVGGPGTGGGVPVHPVHVEVVLDGAEPLPCGLGTLRAGVGGVGRAQLVAVPGGRRTLLEPPTATRVVLETGRQSLQFRSGLLTGSSAQYRYFV